MKPRRSPNKGVRPKTNFVSPDLKLPKRYFLSLSPVYNSPTSVAYTTAVLLLLLITSLFPVIAPPPSPLNIHESSVTKITLPCQTTRQKWLELYTTPQWVQINYVGLFLSSYCYFRLCSFASSLYRYYLLWSFFFHTREQRNENHFTVQNDPAEMTRTLYHTTMGSNQLCRIFFYLLAAFLVYAALQAASTGTICCCHSFFYTRAA